MNEENMVLKVLNEVLEELQLANKSLKEMDGTVKTLETRVQAFEQKEIRIEPPDLEPLKEKIDGLPDVIKAEVARMDQKMEERVGTQCAAIHKETAGGLLRVAAAVEAQPKPIIRRISLFPENDTQRNYKTTIWAIMGGILGVSAIAAAYVLFNLWILRMHPERAVSSTSMPPFVDSPATSKTVLSPVKRAGTVISHGRLKKSENKFDTLNYNSINHILDSLRQKIEKGR